METGTQYDEHDVTMATDFDGDVTPTRSRNLRQMEETSGSEISCSSGSDGFMFTSHYDTPHAVRMGVTEL